MRASTLALAGIISNIDHEEYALSKTANPIASDHRTSRCRDYRTAALSMSSAGKCRPTATQGRAQAIFCPLSAVWPVPSQPEILERRERIGIVYQLMMHSSTRSYMPGMKVKTSILTGKHLHRRSCTISRPVITTTGVEEIMQLLLA